MGGVVEVFCAILPCSLTHSLHHFLRFLDALFHFGLELLLFLWSSIFPFGLFLWVFVIIVSYWVIGFSQEFSWVNRPY